MKAMTGVIAGILAFLLLIAAVLEFVGLTPDEELPEDLKVLAALDYTGTGGYNEHDGITWLTPCNYTESTRRYGMDLHPIYGDYRMHYGVDMGAPQGTPIYATRSGTVSLAAYNDSCGNYVVLRHDENFTSTYMHMVYYIVATGQEVRQGQVIGYVGSTGDSTGPHLHFEIGYRGSPVDPELYIDMSKRPTGDEEDDGKPITDDEKEEQ